MTKDELITQLSDLLYSTPVCMKEPCNAVKGIICINEENCINNKIRKLISKVEKGQVND